jgi:hypothetical protein
MKKWLIFLLSSFWLMGGCVAEEVEQPKNEQNTPPPDSEEQTISLLDFFPNKPLEKQFLGIGNEYAQYNERFYEKVGDYVPAIIDNGGTRLLRIYKVTEKEISIVYEQAEFYEETIPSIDSLEPSFQSKPLLSLPLKVGKNIDGWEIVKINDTITVPFAKFNDVVVLEKTNEDGSINRQYWAKEYGKVKDEYTLEEDNGNIYNVISELQAIK